MARTSASPLLANLAGRLARGDAAATDDFWSRVERTGTSVVEPDTAHAGHSIVSFVGAREYGRNPGGRLDTNLTALLLVRAR